MQQQQAPGNSGSDPTDATPALPDTGSHQTNRQAGDSPSPSPSPSSSHSSLSVPHVSKADVPPTGVAGQHQHHRATPRDHSHIRGWGADLATADRPAYPKERMPQRLDVPWDEPAQQPQTVEILHSTERPGITRVFGTPNPPRGLSGQLRRVSFKYSENDLRHWLMLLFADRVDMVEGVLSDLARGHVPNVFAEMGWKAELQHNRPAFLRKVATVSAITVLGVYLLSRRRSAAPMRPSALQRMRSR